MLFARNKFESYINDSNKENCEFFTENCISTFVKNTDDTEHKQVNAAGANSRKLDEIEKDLTDLIYF